MVAARIDELGLFEAQGADIDDCMRPFRSVVGWYSPESWTSMCHDCSGSGRARRLAVGGRRTMRCDWRAPRHGAPAAPPVSASPGEAGLAPSLHAAPAACGVASAAAAARDAPLRGRFRFGRSPARDPAAVERNWFGGAQAPAADVDSARRDRLGGAQVPAAEVEYEEAPLYQKPDCIEAIKGSRTDPATHDYVPAGAPDLHASGPLSSTGWTQDEEEDPFAHLGIDEEC